MIRRRHLHCRNPQRTLGEKRIGRPADNEQTNREFHDR
jgi:hypothetical protein